MAVREAGRGVEIKSREVRLETPEQPLHSPKLTQRRAHPAVVYSTPAGERERPRVRRGHVEKTRGGFSPGPSSVSKYETVFQILDIWRGGALRQVLSVVSLATQASGG